MSKSAPIVHFLYEPGDGGLDRVAIYLANGMAERGMNTELWLTKREGPLAALISPDVKVRLVPSVGFVSRGLRLFLQIPALAKMIRVRKPRVIFSAGNQSNLNLAIARKLAGSGAAKIIQKITNPINRPGMSRWTMALRKFRFGRTIALGDLCMALSEPDAESYREMFPKSRSKIASVCNAYVTQQMTAIGDNRQAERLPPSPQLLAVGRIAKQKDYATMIGALALNKDRPWNLTILGSGPLEKDTKDLARKLGIMDRISFEGFVSDPLPYYAKADILILSSRWEGFAAVPLEAMAAGLQLVSTDNSAGLTHILANIGQKTVAVEDPEALSEAIDQTLRRRGHPNLRALAAPYSLENSVEDHLRLLDKLESAS